MPKPLQVFLISKYFTRNTPLPYAPAMPTENEKRLTDAELRDLLDKGIPQAQIAKLYHVSPQYVSKRVKTLDKRAAARSAPQSAQAAGSMWQARSAAQANYDGLMSLLEKCETVREEIQIRAEIRAHIAFGVQSLDALYNAEDAEAFQNEVLQVLDDTEPGSRQKILDRLREKRPLREAFSQG